MLFRWLMINMNVLWNVLLLIMRLRFQPR